MFRAVEDSVRTGEFYVIIANSNCRLFMSSIEDAREFKRILDKEEWDRTVLKPPNNIVENAFRRLVDQQQLDKYGFPNRNPIPMDAETAINGFMNHLNAIIGEGPQIIDSDESEDGSSTAGGASPFRPRGQSGK